MEFYDVTFRIDGRNLPQKLIDKPFNPNELLDHEAIAKLVHEGKAEASFSVHKDNGLEFPLTGTSQLVVQVEVFAKNEDEIIPKALEAVMTATHFRNYRGLDKERFITYYFDNMVDLEYDDYNIIMGRLNNYHVNKIR